MSCKPIRIDVFILFKTLIITVAWSPFKTAFFLIRLSIFHNVHFVKCIYICWVFITVIKSFLHSCLLRYNWKLCSFWWLLGVSTKNLIASIEYNVQWLCYILQLLSLCQRWRLQRISTDNIAICKFFIFEMVVKRDHGWAVDRIRISG